MNSHTTPRGYPFRPLPGASSHQQSQKQPVAPPQVSNNEDYNTIADEDREHIDEVVRAPLSFLTLSKPCPS